MKPHLSLIFFLGILAIGNASAAPCTEPVGGRDELAAKIVSNVTHRVFRLSEVFQAEPIQISTEAKYTTKMVSGNLIEQVPFCDRLRGFKFLRDEAQGFTGKSIRSALQCEEPQDFEVYLQFNPNYCAFEFDFAGGHYLVDKIDANGNLVVDDFLRGFRYTFQPQI